MTLMEVLVVMALMAVIAGSLSTLVAAAVRSKLIVAVRAADTETARQTLEWMSERLRNAGLNLRPSAQTEPRCQDMVVAQDAALQPTAGAFYVSGEILNSDTTAGNEVLTLGYSVGPDPVTGTPVVLEYQQPCLAGAVGTTVPLSDPRVRVTTLAFDYFSGSGLRVTDLTNPAEIRRIRLVRITLTVQGAQGASGTQAQTWTRAIMLRNPEPNANDWVNPNEDF